MNRYLSWHIASIGISALIFFPLVTLAWLSLSADANIWAHLLDTVLADYISNSLTLMVGVGVLTLILGIGSAYLITQYDFCLLYTSPSPRDATLSRMPSSA